MARYVPIIGAMLIIPSVACADPRALARRIDELLAASHKANKIKPAAPADDAEFMRRAALDLTGRIPQVSDVRAFLAERTPDKRHKLIQKLLDDPRHATHFTNVWRSILVPELATSANGGYFRNGFESWLRQRFRENIAYDTMVRELLTTPIATDPKAAEVVFRDAEKPNPLAFFAVKDAQPENLAAVTARLFLGVQLECAQCHDHPFASWTREQFWNQAAFFAGIERQGKSQFAPLTEAVERREVIYPHSKRKVPAIFLDGKKPQFKQGASSRVGLADWITSGDNPFFARATVNRLWDLLFGLGIVDPVDNFHDQNAPSHPELLDELASAFVASKYNLNYIITAICLTDAYQRTSARSHASQDDPRLFGRMSVRGMTGEQFLDSVLVATGFQENGPAKFGKKGKGPALSPRAQFLSLFAPQGRLSEPEASIQQTLALMNGRFITGATSLRGSATLTAACETPLLKTADRIEILYLATLSRRPTARELERLNKFVAVVESAREAERLADIFWVLLNSAEFRLNH
jgi:hypothetical protein